jgi:guanosine-3',5'-bis(diphosphate) 3'-pyrophosphohydrolase
MNPAMILKAAQFAARKHRNHRRKDRNHSPYINHPINVAFLLAVEGGIDDPEILAAALLHDTVEDTDTLPEEIESLFGKRVHDIVTEVSDNKTLPKKERKKRQVEHAPVLSSEAALVKLGDKIDNVNDVIHSPPVDWNIERRREYMEWCARVINSLPKVNPSLELKFRETLEKGFQKLSSQDAGSTDRKDHQ